MFSEKMSSLISEEDQLKSESVTIQTECDNLKAKFQEKVGQKELELTMSLEKMSVDRQAYHGNVFVGNHCKKILKKFTNLTSVLKADSPELESKFNKIFAIFRDIQRLISANRFCQPMKSKRLACYATNLERCSQCYFLTGV